MRRTRIPRRWRWHRNSRELKVRRIAALLGAKDFQRAADFAGQGRRSIPMICAFRSCARTPCCRSAIASARLLCSSPSPEPIPNDATTQLALADLLQQRGTEAGRGGTVRQLVRDRARQRRRVELSRLPARGSWTAARRSNSSRSRALDINPAHELSRQPRLGVLPPRRLRPGGYSPAAQRIAANATVQEHLGDHPRQTRTLGRCDHRWTRAAGRRGRCGTRRSSEENRRRTG